MTPRVAALIILAVWGVSGCLPSSPPAPPAVNIDAVLYSGTPFGFLDGPNAFTLTLTNRENEPMTMMKPNGGFDSSGTPKVTWTVRNKKGNDTTNSQISWCGVKDLDRSEEIVRLQPGESVSWVMWMGIFCQAPGEYEVSLEYRHDPKGVQYTSGDAHPELWEMWKSGKGFSVVTNSVKMVVKDIPVDCL